MNPQFFKGKIKNLFSAQGSEKYFFLKMKFSQKKGVEKKIPKPLKKHIGSFVNSLN